MIDTSEIGGSISGRRGTFQRSRPCNIDRTQKEADDFQGPAVTGCSLREEQGAATKRRMLSQNPSPRRRYYQQIGAIPRPHLLKLSSSITYTPSLKELILSWKTFQTIRWLSRMTPHTKGLAETRTFFAGLTQGLPEGFDDAGHRQTPRDRGEVAFFLWEAKPWFRKDQITRHLLLTCLRNKHIVVPDAAMAMQSVRRREEVRSIARWMAAEHLRASRHTGTGLDLT